MRRSTALPVAASIAAQFLFAPAWGEGASLGRIDLGYSARYSLERTIVRSPEFEPPTEASAPDSPPDTSLDGDLNLPPTSSGPDIGAERNAAAASLPTLGYNAGARSNHVGDPKSVANKLFLFGRLGAFRWNSKASDCTDGIAETECGYWSLSRQGMPKLPGKIYFGGVYRF